MIAERHGAPPGQPKLTGRLVVGNVGWNLLGQGAPIIAALVCIPILARSLGTAAFGLLALSWTFVGYFSIFDLGLGEAMTRSVAAKLAVGDSETVHVTAWTTLSVMAALGTMGTVVAWVLAPAIIHILRIPSGLQAEALRTVQLLALSIPLVITSVGLRGILEAHLRFRLVNAVRTPLGIWTYVGPIVVLPFSHSLVLIVGVLLLGRAAGFLVYLGFCLSVVPSLRSIAIRWSLLPPLLTFGGWLTIDNLINPLTNFLDRFLIGILVSVAAVAYYSVPYELAAKAWVLPVAVSGVLFPTFTRVLARDRDQARLLFRRGAKFLLFAMFPITLVMVCLAEPGLRVWIGPQYAARSSLVLQLLAVGVLVTSIGSLADTFIGSAGRPDISAKLGLAKFALHFIPLWWVISTYGIVGVAALWVACSGLESLGMLLVALRFQGVGWARILRRALQSIPVWVLLAGAAIALPVGWKLAYVTAVILGLAPVTWRRLMSPGERSLVRAWLKTKPMLPSTTRP